MFGAIVISGIAWIATFFAIYWLPFARIPFSSDFFLRSILAPVEFLLGSLCLFVACMTHGLLFRVIFTPNGRKGIKILSFLGWLSPLMLLIFSVKVVILLFSISIIYGILSTERTKEKKAYDQQRSL